MKHLIITDESSVEIGKYDIDECLWNEILIHYIDLRQSDADIGECFKLINDNLCRRSGKSEILNRAIDRLTEINKIYAYLKDISNGNAFNIIRKVDSNEVSVKFINLLESSDLTRVDMIKFFDDHYGADFRNSSLSADVWTKMRPLSDEGKTRGYSGPAELPLLLFAGGCKADKGDMYVDTKLIEIKGEGGRIGEFSRWCNSKSNIEHIISQFNNNILLNSHQIEFNFIDPLYKDTSHYDFSHIPYEISCIVKHLIAKQLISTKADVIDFIGCVQLTQYILNRKDDWFMLFKHPGKKTAPFGTSFIVDVKKVELTDEYVEKLYRSIKVAGVTFSPCYDSGGYKIKFAR